MLMLLYINAIYLKIRGAIHTLLILSCISGCDVEAQTHQVSFSLEPTHINTDNAQGVFNASGFKLGYVYRFKQGMYILAELGSTSLFGRDTPSQELQELLAKGPEREAFEYRVLRTGGSLKLVGIKSSSFFIHAGASLRHANEIIHDRSLVAYQETRCRFTRNTSCIVLKTAYEERWDTGAFLGISWQQKLGSFLDLSIFAETDRYMEQHSFITAGIKTFFNLSK